MQDLFFYTAKIGWLLFRPDSLFLILLTLTLILIWMGRNRSARSMLTLLVVLAWTISLLPIGGWLSYPLDTRFPTNPSLPERLDGIIVLGGSINIPHSDAWNQVETNDFSDRLFYFISLARQYPQAKLVFTGGNASVSGKGSTEADTVAQLLTSRGLGPERLYLENRSRNTEENVLYSYELVQPSSDENWLLITSAAHMPRSVGLFCKHDWPVIPFPVDHSSNPDRLFKVNLDPAGHAYGLVWALREWAGLTAYYLSGRIDQWFPTGCNDFEANG